MPKLSDTIKSQAIKLVSKLGNSLSQEETARAAADKTVTEGMPELLRQVAAEGAVLLENDGTLPLKEGSRVSVFGRVAFDWFYTGYGSGGDVNKPYQVSLIDAVRGCDKLRLNESLAGLYENWVGENPIDHGYWAHWPRFYPDMPLRPEQAAGAAKESDCAIVVIGRASGEDRENALEKGSYYLTEEEITLLDQVTAAFDKTIVLLNIGSVMDLAKLKSYGDKISALMIVWQGGMESGNAITDLLTGEIAPSGKLSDTIAAAYEYYPSSKNFGNPDFNHYEEDIYVGYRWFETFGKSKVLYPFGYGLTYADFEISCQESRKTEEGFAFDCVVKNASKTYSGKEVVQLYVKKPCGALGNPARELVAFYKTGLLAPGEAEQVTLEVPLERLTSYDSRGDAGCRSAFIIQKGDYEFYLGSHVKNAEKVMSVSYDEPIVVEQLEEACAPAQPFTIIKAEVRDGKRVPVKKTVPTATVDLKSRILEGLPQSIPQTGDLGYKLQDVADGRVTLKQFTAQLTTTELEAISRGDYTMNSALGTPGNAGVLGGVLESLRQKGVSPITTTDGPSGIRLHASCSLIPIGTLLACTFDTQLVQRLYQAVGGEMKEKGSHVLLAPGMNIHRDPLCGRNFEYFSEDPYLCGMMAAAAVKGLQSKGVSACPKHFACNNQEYQRNKNDSRVSERALREIYLKGFEICVKTARPENLMTSYNKINGVWSHYNYDLCTTILRKEWGYQGSVMTDWWMRSSKSPEFPSMRDNAYRVRAQVDVLMPGGKQVGRHKPDKTLLKTYGKRDGITLGEMQRGAMNVLRMVLWLTEERQETKNGD